MFDGLGPPWSKGLIKRGSNPQCCARRAHSLQKAHPGQGPAVGPKRGVLSRYICETQGNPCGWRAGQQGGCVLWTELRESQGKTMKDKDLERDSEFYCVMRNHWRILCRAVCGMVWLIFLEQLTFPLLKKIYH